MGKGRGPSDRKRRLHRRARKRGPWPPTNTNKATSDRKRRLHRRARERGAKAAKRRETKTATELRREIAIWPEISLRVEGYG